MLFLQSMTYDRGHSWSTLAHCYFLEVFLLWLFIEDDLDLAEIPLLPAATTLGVVPDSSVSFGLSDDAAMNPQPERVQIFVLGVIQEVVEGSDHVLGNFLVAVLKLIDGVEDMHFPYAG